jgi:hypothetical protein
VLTAKAELEKAMEIAMPMSFKLFLCISVTFDFIYFSKHTNRANLTEARLFY